MYCSTYFRRNYRINKQIKGKIKSFKGEVYKTTVFLRMFKFYKYRMPLTLKFKRLRKNVESFGIMKKLKNSKSNHRLSVGECEFIVELD